MSLEDILRQLSGKTNHVGTPQYGAEVPQYNAFQQAPTLAKAIIEYQKEQRTTPYINAIQGYSQQYGAATTNKERQRANSTANAARSAFLHGGGSPMDLPQSVWGSDPGQGFQTDVGQYAPALNGMEGLSNAQREKATALKRQALIDALDPKMDPRYKTLVLRDMQSGIAAANRRNTGGGSSGNAKQSDWEGAIYGTADYYASSEDYLADLDRYKQQIVGLVGVAGYRRLVNDAQNMESAGSKFKPGGNSNFTYGNGSPLGTALYNSGVLQGG